MPFKTSELDLFAIESRAKQTVTQMMTPVIESIKSERIERARVEVKYDQIQARVQAIEALLEIKDSAGTAPKKP